MKAQRRALACILHPKVIAGFDSGYAEESPAWGHGAAVRGRGRQGQRPSGAGADLPTMSGEKSAPHAHPLTWLLQSPKPISQHPVIMAEIDTERE